MLHPLRRPQVQSTSNLERKRPILQSHNEQSEVEVDWTAQEKHIACVFQVEGTHRQKAYGRTCLFHWRFDEREPRIEEHFVSLSTTERAVDGLFSKASGFKTRANQEHAQPQSSQTQIRSMGKQHILYQQPWRCYLEIIQNHLKKEGEECFQPLQKESLRNEEIRLREIQGELVRWCKR